MPRSSRRSAKNLGRTQRIVTLHDYMQQLNARVFPSKFAPVDKNKTRTADVSHLDLQRKYFPQELLKAEEETAFYGS